MGGNQEKPLVWLGSSLKDLKEFPVAVKTEIGHALNEAQYGLKPKSAKPLRGFGGATTLEVIDDYQTNTYRAVYTVRFAGVVYVLHAFQKKSKQGTETSQSDIKLINSRLKDAQQHYQEWLEGKARDSKGQQS